MNDQRALILDAYPRRTTWQPATTRIDGRVLGLIMGLLLLAAAAGLLYLTQASAATEARFRLAEVEAEQADLAEQISVLRCQVAASESFGALEKRAAGLGLVDAPPNDPVIVCVVPDGPSPSSAAQQGGQGTGPDTPLDRLLALLPLKP